MTYHHETVQNLIKTGNRTGVWRGRWAIDALGECACTRLAHAGPRWRTAWSTVWPSGRARLCWSCTVWQYFPPKGRLEEKRGSSQKTAASRPASGRSERTAAHTGATLGAHPQVGCLPTAQQSSTGDSTAVALTWPHRSGTGSKKQLFLPQTSQEGEGLLPPPVQVHRAQYHRNTKNPLQRSPRADVREGQDRGHLYGGARG